MLRQAGNAGSPGPHTSAVCYGWSISACRHPIALGHSASTAVSGPRVRRSATTIADRGRGGKAVVSPNAPKQANTIVFETANTV